VKASVICPTFNGGPTFKKCLESLLSQKVNYPYEIIIVDSSSKDGTAEFLESQSSIHENLRVHSIPQSEFGHGKTRNLAISLAGGEFIAVITQDAIPQGSAWLKVITEDLERHPEAAGAFGRHIAYPGSGPIVEHEINAHFEQFGKETKAYRIEDKKRFESDECHRQFLHFFSDNNACVRRSAWEKIPYPEVEFCEDQVWAKTFLEAGYSKIWSPHAVVMHSHSFGFRETLIRCYEESKHFKRLFGYKLGKNLPLVILRAYRETIKDFRTLQKRERLPAKWKWLIKGALNNLAKTIGHYMGTYR
jgi:rhamnosyltransferase